MGEFITDNARCVGRQRALAGGRLRRRHPDKIYSALLDDAVLAEYLLDLLEGLG